MSTSTEFDKLALQVQRAYFEDGLAEIFMGGILLLVAAFVLLISQGAPFVLIGVILLNPIFLQHLIEAAKRRWVYPRAGYVKPKPLQETSRRNNLLGVALILSILIGPVLVLFALLGFTGLVIWAIWVAPVSAGLLLSIGPMIVARKYQLYRYYLFAILPPLIGLIIPWLNLSFPNMYAAFFTIIAIEVTVVGIPALLSGAVLFLRFIRRHPVEPTDLAEGESTNATP